MSTIASLITSLAVVYSTVYSDADQRKHQSSASLAFVWGIPRDRWIPRTKGQLRGKCFHLMTSSWKAHAWENLYESCFFRSILQRHHMNVMASQTTDKWTVCSAAYLCKHNQMLPESLGGDSLTFRELSKIFSQNLCVAEIVLLMRISSWNFVRVSKSLLWAHVPNFSLTFST